MVDHVKISLNVVHYGCRAGNGKKEKQNNRLLQLKMIETIK